MKYNEIINATVRSNKAQKTDRKAFRKWSNSKNGQRAIFSEAWDEKLLELQERENRIKAENPKYKKKFKYQLEAEIRELWKPKIAFSVDISQFKREPRFLYFDRVWGEPVYNIAGRENGAEARHREFLKKNRETCEKQRVETARREAQERAEYWKKEIEKRKKQAGKLKEKQEKEAITTEREAKIETLENGSYKWNGEQWENMSYALGYMVEIAKYEEKQELKRGQHLGVWKDESDGKLYVGVSKLIKSKQKAVELAKNAKHNYETGEKAIWDCKNQCEIRI